MKKNYEIKRRRVIALLNREEIEYLDKLSMDALFTTGLKLSRVGIIAALVDAAMSLGISGKGIKGKKEFVQQMLNAAGTHSVRRKFPRLKKNLIVGFRKMDSMGQYENAATKDIGMGGVRVDVAFLGKPLSVNQVIEIAIEDPNGTTKPIKAIGRIAWITRKEGAHGYEVGVMLTYIEEEDRERFIKCLSEGMHTENLKHSYKKDK